MIIIFSISIKTIISIFIILLSLPNDTPFFFFSSSFYLFFLLFLSSILLFIRDHSCWRRLAGWRFPVIILLLGISVFIIRLFYSIYLFISTILFFIVKIISFILNLTLIILLLLFKVFAWLFIVLNSDIYWMIF